MRVLIVANSAERRLALAREVERAHGEVCGTSDVVSLARNVQRFNPEAILLEADPAAAREVLPSARASARMRPGLVLLAEAPNGEAGELSREFGPAVIVPGSPDAAIIERALEELEERKFAERNLVRAGVLTLDRTTREVRGPKGRTALTPSEAAILAALAEMPGAVTPVERLGRALWGSTALDRHARGAIRSHIYTLRRKLARIGLPGAVVSLGGVGYRFEVPQQTNGHRDGGPEAGDG